MFLFLCYYVSMILFLFVTLCFGFLVLLFLFLLSNSSSYDLFRYSFKGREIFSIGKRNQMGCNCKDLFIYFCFVLFCLIWVVLQWGFRCFSEFSSWWWACWVFELCNWFPPIPQENMDLSRFSAWLLLLILNR